MRKAEIESWSKLGEIFKSKDSQDNQKKSLNATEKIVSQVEAVDLSGV